MGAPFLMKVKSPRVRIGVFGAESLVKLYSHALSAKKSAPLQSSPIAFSSGSDLRRSCLNSLVGRAAFFFVSGSSFSHALKKSARAFFSLPLACLEGSGYPSSSILLHIVPTACRSPSTLCWRLELDVFPWKKPTLQA